jgi:hypothetical protein
LSLRNAYILVIEYGGLAGVQNGGYTRRVRVMLFKLVYGFKRVLVKNGKI